MTHRKLKYDQQRAAEKQASRDQDEADLKSGKKTVEQLQAENGIFSLKGAKLNLRKSKNLY